MLRKSTAFVPRYQKFESISPSSESDANSARSIVIPASLVCGPEEIGGVPKIRALYEATYFTGLRKAGMPEE